MNFFSSSSAAIVFLTCAAILSSAAQITPPAAQSHQGKVILSRSTDENGQTTPPTGPNTPAPAVQMAAASSVQDAERQAVTFTAYDLDVRLRPMAQHIAVRALITVRNDDKMPLTRLPLQISSSLNWEGVRANNRNLTFQGSTLNSDTDHTGQLHEAVIALAQPLAPGQSLQLDVAYSGAIAASAQRLLAIGTPQNVAANSDWDQIDPSFTGLRGFGNVVWYPVSSVPVVLGDGARLFDEIGEHKLRLAGAHFRLRLTVEFPHGQAPTVALINGHPAQLTITESGGLDQSQEVASVASAKLDGATLGFETPSLFVAIRTPHPGLNLTAWTLPENQVAVGAWTTAATTVTPFLQSWLGQQPRSQLTLLDLPDPEDAPYETGALLATSLREAAPAQLDATLAHALTHAWMQSPRAWLDEGVAHFMGTLWLEKQRGHDQALSALEAGRPALALAEPESPGHSAGQPLAQAVSPVYYRSKATYVLWMLRNVAGDRLLSTAFSAYDPAQDLGKESSFEKLLEQAGPHSDLSWFFADWVDADKGLPDLSIESAFPTTASAGNWLIAINLANSGYAQAEVPVTVRSAAASVTERVRVPARGKAVQRILIQGKPTEVQLNDGTVPETQSSFHLMKLDGPEASTTAPNPPQQ